MLNRRQFVQSLLASGVSVSLTGCANLFEDKNLVFLSGCDDRQGNHYIGAFNQTGELLFKQATSGRCHGGAQHPLLPNRAVSFARRPGEFLIEVDVKEGVITKTVKSESNRHFFGHGCFTYDGNFLITTENDYANGRGLVVVRDSKEYQVVAEYDSGGIGPHECALLNRSDTLVVANGGILTHPKQSRKKLNLDSMQPNLSYLDLNSGKVLESFQPSHHRMSIRHLAVSEQDVVVAGVQYQGNSADNVPLVLFHGGEEKLNERFAPDHLMPKMKQYTASLAIDDSHKQVIVTCPRGHLATLWDLNEYHFINSVKIRDTAGAAFDASQSRFVLTNGFGAINQLTHRNSLAKSKINQFRTLKWDNHLVVLSS